MMQLCRVYASIFRLIWVILTLAMATTLIGMLYIQFSNYAKNPTLTKINAAFHKELDFPAVTICNLNMFQRSIVNCTGHQNADYMFDLFKQLSDVATLEHIISMNQVRGSLSGEILRKCAIEYSNKLEDLLVLCLWDGMLKNCSAIFQMTITEYGICYTFKNDTGSPVSTESIGANSGLRVLVDIKQDDYFFSRTIQAGIKVQYHKDRQINKIHNII